MSQIESPTPSAGLARLVPGLKLLREYRRDWLVRDVLAGVSVCLVMIPSVIAYAGLLGLPPQCGLYAALVPLIVYPLFGASRQVIVGPDIALCLLMASAITPLAGGDPRLAASLAATLTLLSGLLLLLGARAKVGAVADFLSRPVLIGYMTGAALILIASQLGKLFGIPLKENEFLPRVAELAFRLRETHGLTLAFGLALLAVVIALRRLAPRIPVALPVCLLAWLGSWAFALESKGLAVVGVVPRGLPGFALPEMNWASLRTLLPAAIGIALLTYAEAILLARAFAARKNYEINANQELNALGLCDLAAACFQGFAATGSQARTTINDAAGARSQLAGLAAAAALAVFLLFLTPLIAHLPAVALAVVLIYGGLTLVEFDAMKRIYRFYPRSAGVAALTTVGVLAAGVVPGILIGVVLSLLGLISRISNPPDAVLREVPGHGFHDLGDAAMGRSVPGLLAYRFYAPLLFSNIGHFTARVRHLIAVNPTPVRWFLLDAQAISDIDVTAAEALHALHEELRRRGVALKIAHANRPLLDLLKRTGLAGEISSESFFPSVHECVDAFEKLSSPPSPSKIQNPGAA